MRDQTTGWSTVLIAPVSLLTRVWRKSAAAPKAVWTRYQIEVLLCIFALAIIGAVWGLAIEELAHARANFLSNAEHDATTLARVFEEHSLRSIESADQAAKFLRYEFQQKGRSLDLQALQSSGVLEGDIFNLFSVVGPDGYVALSSKPFGHVDLRDREHVRVHRDRATDEIFISKPVRGRVSGKWSMQITRRISNPDGAFGGVVVVSVDPFYFTHFYESARLGPHSVVTLIGDDGIVRARRVDGEDQIGQDLSTSKHFSEIRQRQSGTFSDTSMVDGRERIYAFRRLESFPMTVVVGIDTADALQPFERLKAHLMTQATITTFVVLACIALLLLLVHRLTNSREQAVAANAAKTEFLSKMSHELRTPLNGILGYAELLSADIRDDEQRSFARLIHQSGTHLLSLLNALLNLSKIEAGEVELNVSTENVRGLLRRAISAHRSSALRKSLRLDIDIAPDVPLFIACDRDKVLQVLNNLLHNALKFTEKGGVRIDVSRQGGALMFRVTDSGIGIPEEIQSAIFQKFFQAENGYARSSDGTGLGLAIVKELVKLMGGEVFLQSVAGKGTTFSFTLPLVAPGTDASGEAALAASLG